MARPVSILCLTAALLTTGVARAQDKSGLDPSRVKLPKGPGSLEGVGENAEPNLNRGTLHYAVPIDLPAGYPGATPSLRLAYGSDGGASEVGIGWGLSTPSIERMTLRGLPRYDASDVFAANGGDELVRLPGSATYRARFEGGFVRYTFVDSAGTGREGYWITEYPDGRVGYFGADAAGTEVAAARTQGPAGTFAYQLVETIDVFGHRVSYTYAKDGARPLLRHIGWAHDGGGTPRYEAELLYEARPDALSDGKPGFEVRLTQRLASILVKARQTQRWRYELTYESAALSGGLSRLSRLRRFGTDPALAHPVVFNFTYSRGLGAACTSCPAPYLVELGSVGVDFATGDADLVDLNGDGLPDVVDTSSPQHLLHLNALQADGTQGYMYPVTSATGTSAQLRSPLVQVVDLNGDSFADVVDAANQRVLWNRGTGDWVDAGVMNSHLPPFDNDANLRFFDYDYDKKPDVIHADASNTFYYRNRGDGTFETQAVLGESIGWGFADSGLRMADMNGDGMQDAVLLLGGGVVAYRMYLGYGRFAPLVEMFGLDSSLQPASVELTDLNGDSLTDVVLVQGVEVRYALNEDGESFGALVTLSSADGGSIPERTSAVSVRFADMNGSGSTDVVWINASGKVTFLELFPERANLLLSLTNGIGQVMAFGYGSSVLHMARDGGAGAWSDRLPHAMVTLDRVTVRDTLSGVPQEQVFAYHHGFCDGTERQFRGYRTVEVTRPGDTSEDAERAYVFDVGRGDPYRRGKLLEERSYSGARLLRTSFTTYDDCPLAETAGTAAVRYVCPTESRTVVQEGQSESHWVTLTTRTTYDGYGNATLVEKLGAPAPGDEFYDETDFVARGHTGGRWVLRAVSRKRQRTEPQGIYSEETTYYDGEPFVGLQLGELTEGRPTRVTQKERADTANIVEASRHRFDAHGNVVELLDANGHRRRFGYGADGLLPTSEEVVFDTPGRPVPYTLRLGVDYHPVLDQVVRSVDWQRYESGVAISPARETLYDYDAFGRLTKVARPGDSLALPTASYAYELADPISRIVERQRSVSGEAPDVETVQCFDGLGRKLETRVLSSLGTYEVSGLSRYNAQGKAFLAYQPSTSASGACDAAAPAHGLATRTLSDGEGRALAVTHPDSGIYGTASVERTDYLPLRTVVNDGEDTGPASAHAGTPGTTSTDGLGRAVRIERRLSSTMADAWTFSYDALSRLGGITDARGFNKRWEYDLLGRIVRITDPDAGVITRAFDGAGNLTRETDARGLVVRRAYDETNRLGTEWLDTDRAGTLIEYTYDAAADCPEPGACTYLDARLAALRYPGGEEHYGYDARGRAEYLARQIDGHLFATRTRYDNFDRVVGRSYPDGQSLTFAYDGASRLLGIPGFVNDVAYNGRGLPGTLSLANDTSTHFTYDDRLRQASSFTVGPQGLLLGYGYTYDRVGNPTVIVDSRPADGTPRSNARYGFDAYYRLVEARLDENTAHTETLSYGYDGIDNITRKTSSRGSGPAHVGTYRYEGTEPHAVMRAGDLTYAYDASGNMTLRGSHRLRWDHLGRLVSAHHGERSLIEVGYGPGRERVVKREGSRTTYYVSDDFEVRDGVSAVYARALGGRVAKSESVALAASVLSDLAPDGEITAADAWLAQGYLPLPPGTPVPSDVGALLATSARRMLLGSEPEVTFFHHNHLGTTSASTDASGALVQRAEHYPYGEVRYESHGYLTEYSFTGKERDESTGLSYHSARYLDPRIGRWVSPDPFYLQHPRDLLGSPANGREQEEPAQVAKIFRDHLVEGNGYSYAADNPMVLVDPDGNRIQFAAGASAAFKADFAAMVRYLNASGAAGALASLEANPTIVGVRQATPAEILAGTDFEYRPAARLIVVNPRSGLRVSVAPGAAGVQSPALGMLHEVGHALHHVSNAAQFAADGAAPPPAPAAPGYTWTDVEEFKTIQNIEQPASIKLGEPTRLGHGGPAIASQVVGCATCQL